jgi:predicted negative regulator of RcsB-dependent stress response
MATHLDLQEQEQVDALKAFWQQYGNLITWGLVAALLVYAGITGWHGSANNRHAGAMFGEFDRALTPATSKTARVFADLKALSRTRLRAAGQHAGRQVPFDKGKTPVTPARL